MLAIENNTSVNGVLNIGIPDSAFLEHNSAARSKRDQVNKLLKATNLSRMHYHACPLTYSRGNKNYEPDGLHFSEQGYKGFANGISQLVYSLLK